MCGLGNRGLDTIVNDPHFRNARVVLEPVYRTSQGRLGIGRGEQFTDPSTLFGMTVRSFSGHPKASKESLLPMHSIHHRIERLKIQVESGILRLMMTRVMDRSVVLSVRGRTGLMNVLLAEFSHAEYSLTNLTG